VQGCSGCAAGSAAARSPAATVGPSGAAIISSSSAFAPAPWVSARPQAAAHLATIPRARSERVSRVGPLQRGGAPAGTMLRSIHAICRQASSTSRCSSSPPPSAAAPRCSPTRQPGP
jgi:hypothetical protein